MLHPCYFVLFHSTPESYQVLCLETCALKPWCVRARVALFPWWNGSSPAPWAQQLWDRDPTGCSAVRGAGWGDGKMGVTREHPGRQQGGVWARASCGSAVCAPAAQGACGVLPSLYLWKSLIEMQVIKSNVSCSIHFHCTTTFTSLILSGISAAPLSGFFLVRAMPILSPLCELGRGDNNKPAVDY